MIGEELSNAASADARRDDDRRIAQRRARRRALSASHRVERRGHGSTRAVVTPALRFGKRRTR